MTDGPRTLGDADDERADAELLAAHVAGDHDAFAILVPGDEGRECVRIPGNVCAQQRGVGYGVALRFTLDQATTSTS